MKKLLVTLCTLSVLMGCGTQQTKADRISNVQLLENTSKLNIYSFQKDNKEYLIVTIFGDGVAIIEHKTDTIGNKK